MNGVSAGDLLREKLPRGFVCDSVIYTVSSLEADYSIRQIGKFTDLYLGGAPNDAASEALAEQVIKKITGNKDLIAALTKDPAGLLKTLGINVPSEQINKLVELVREKLGDQTTKSLLAKIKSFFKK